MKLLTVSNRIRFAAVLSCALLLRVVSCESVAQTRGPVKDFVPRVGTIKDYPATGLMAGCANLYFYPASQPRSPETATAYVFLARGDGDDAWMNLGGRDVRLRQIKSLTRTNGKMQRYYYRLGGLRISVVIESLKSENSPMGEGDSTFKMKITLRKGRAVRTVRAVGDADC